MLSPDTFQSWLQLAVAAIVGAVVSMCGVGIANRHARQLAERSGAFRRAKVGLGLFGRHLHQKDSIVAWCVLHPGPERSRALCRLPIFVVNEGDARCDDVILTLQGPAECFGDPDALELTATPPVIDDVIRRGQVDIGRLRQVSYRLTSVGAASALRIDDVLVMSPSVGINSTARFRSKDDIDVAASYEFSFSYRLEWALFTPDDPALHFTTSFYCIEGSDPITAMTQFNRLANKRLNKYLSSAGAWERFRFRVLGRGEKRFVVMVQYGEGEVLDVHGNPLHNFTDAPCTASLLTFLLPRSMPWV